MPISSISRRTAWNAPRALNAPTRCRFSHLKKRRIFGLAGVSCSVSPDNGEEGSCGVDASVLSVVLVSSGVRWMCGSMRACASSTWAGVSAIFVFLFFSLCLSLFLLVAYVFLVT